MKYVKHLFIIKLFFVISYCLQVMKSQDTLMIVVYMKDNRAFNSRVNVFIDTVKLQSAHLSSNTLTNILSSIYSFVSFFNLFKLLYEVSLNSVKSM